MAGGRAILRAALPLLLLLAAACESPSAAFDTAASRHGFERLSIAGDGFAHIVFRNPGEGPALHVYLESDGKPWLRRQLPAGDPTSRDALVLDLMALDPAESVLVGRPCYHGLQDDAPCMPDIWTSRRYAPEVVASLATAVRRLANGWRNLVLIGHSGGGVLAMLVAARLPEASMVVTIAAPLDHAAWTARHGYLPLEGSLNPVEAGGLPGRIRQLHLVGARDTVVPPDLVAAALGRLNAPPPLVVPGLGHNDGWPSLWPAVLACIAAPAGSEAVADAEHHRMLVAPGVAEVADIVGGDGRGLIECDSY